MKIRVVAQRFERRTSPVPKLLYRAEAHRPNAVTTDDPIWTCEHDHVAPLDAHECGLEWLKQNGEPAA